MTAAVHASPLDEQSAQQNARESWGSTITSQRTRGRTASLLRRLLRCELLCCGLLRRRLLDGGLGSGLLGGGLGSGLRHDYAEICRAPRRGDRAGRECERRESARDANTFG